jgi:hypothetical protein
MERLTNIMSAVLVLSTLAGCDASMQPQASAFQRNVGPGSSVAGLASNVRGRGSPGDEIVPGVSSAGATLGD